MLAPDKTFDAVKSSLALSRFISHGGLEATPSPPNVMAAHPPKRFGQVIALEKLFTRMSRSRTAVPSLPVERFVLARIKSSLGADGGACRSCIDGIAYPRGTSPPSGAVFHLHRLPITSL